MPSFKTIINELSIQKNVAPEFLHYIGEQDVSDLLGKILYHFNVMDPRHPKYKSTIVYVVYTK